MNYSLIRSQHQQQVDEFLEKAGQRVRTTPGIPEKAELKQQLSIILEELLELIAASGYEIYDEFGGPIRHHDVSINETGLKPDLVEMVDGCLDLNVVVTGLLSKMGVADVALQDEVNQNNLAKFGPGGYRREDGKWIKPPDHKPPRILKLLVEQGYNPENADGE